MKYFSYSFIDFDDTIFDTGRMVAAMRALFLSAGVSAEDFDSTRRLAVGGDSGQYYDYSFEHHLEAVKELGYTLPNDFLQRLNSLVEMTKFEHPEAREFLSWVRTVSEKIILVTAGNYNFQHKKLASTNLSSFFDEVVIVHGNKGAIVARYIAETTGKILFVNDSLAENKSIAEQFPQALVVGLINPRKSINYQESGIPFFSKLSEITPYVTKQT